MDRIKLSIIHTDYFTTDNKVVTCKITVVASDDTVPFSFVGTASCSPDDKFDFKKGRKLALARAEIEARKYYKKLYNKLYKKFQEALEPINDFCIDCNSQIEHNKEYIKNLIESFDKK